ncbi:BQ5605_C010g05961 [Microbotryum silenes-dioicae]|uniref:BQ5605_C010g05961 protein n=1 Tax=Microbotryum silenes-dioicae TaxID=796604 RepID=A0A2X0NM91_9BASI|nr:BQ5605_C010g05961 [Microbotryum silenes-dioicae]
MPVSSGHSHNHSHSYHDDPFNSPSYPSPNAQLQQHQHSFVSIPVQASSSSQGVNHSSSSSSSVTSSLGILPQHYGSHSSASSVHLATAPSSTQTYRYSTSVEAGDYRPPIGSLSAHHHDPAAASTTSSNHIGHRSSKSVTRQPSSGHAHPPSSHSHSLSHAAHNHPKSMSISGLPSHALHAGSSSASAQSPATTNRTPSIHHSSTYSPSSSSSSHDVTMAPPPISVANSAASTSSSSSAWSVWSRPSNAAPSSMSSATTTSASHSQHYRASPSLSSAQALIGSGAGSSLPPPHVALNGSSLMRRGSSYDGTPTRSATMYNLPAATSPTITPRLQTSGLVPNPYSSARSRAGSGSGSGSYSPMGGVQQTGQTSPIQTTPLGPNQFGGASGGGHGSSQSISSAHPNASRITNEHMRDFSYSPSQYSTEAAAAASSSALFPNSPLMGNANASSFYANHIPAATSSTSLPTGVPVTPRPSSHSPHPPHPPLTPSHQPQAQQYYQSQHYYDSNMASGGKGKSIDAPSRQTSGYVASSAAASSSAPAVNPAAMYYAGHDFRSSAATAPPAVSAERVGRGLRRVRDPKEIKRTINQQPAGRRADPAGGFVSPLKALTLHLPQTYHLVNPAFRYETSLNPRRVLTKPSKPAMNDGFDNEDSDYILYVNDVLGPEDKERYLILDVLGQGTFGQVVKCQNMKTHEIVAVKVVKNKPAYFQQSMMEVTILELINNQWDKDDEHHMLRLKDTFIHHSHLCLVFELLSNNLYELIKQNSFRGLSTSLVRVFTAQLLDALTVLHEAKIIHCDLKPENILLKSLQSPTIKVIDFGSACHEKQTVYTYIQSRFYRSPEVILSLPYSASIDMWSLGCICVELFLGLPLFPGTSEFNQITRIVEMLGMPPNHMLDKGKQTMHFFDQYADEYGQRRWRLKTLERYSQENKVQEQPSKRYFAQSTLPEIIQQYPIVRKGLKEADAEKERKNRLAFIDFVKGLLNLDPEQRWTPQQARLHPFVLGEPFLQPFVPPPHIKGGAFVKSPAIGSSSSSSASADAKRYGGLPAATPRTTQGRIYDAKAYGQHLQQQQNYTIQAQQAAQRAAAIPTNPYAVDMQAQAAAVARQQSQYQQQQHQQQSMALAQQQQQQHHQQLQQHMQVAGGYGPAGASSFSYASPQNTTVANPPAAHHYTSTRGRSNTGGTQELPPALQKVGQTLGVAVGTGQSVTPVLRRDDQWQAWERISTDGQGVQRRISVSSRHPHLNLLQEQAENGLNSWASPMRAKPTHGSQASFSGYYASPQQPQPPSFSVVVDNRGPPVDLPGIAAPPLAYSTAGSSNRYAPYSTGPSNPGAGGGYDLAFDAFGGASANPALDGLGVYQPMQPYQQANARGMAGAGAGAGDGSVLPTTMQQSLYSAHLPFSPGHQAGQSNQSKAKQW